VNHAKNAQLILLIASARGRGIALFNWPIKLLLTYYAAKIPRRANVLDFHQSDARPPLNSAILGASVPTHRGSEQAICARRSMRPTQDSCRRTPRWTATGRLHAGSQQSGLPGGDREE
jgi:hypothetical protein